MNPSTKFDLHLSAYAITPETIRKVEALGFRRDEFANNTRCDTTAYHGTFRGERQLPDDELWHELDRVFEEDASFVGGLEEEEFSPSETIQLIGSNGNPPSMRPPIAASAPAAGTYKACDIHINVNLPKTTPEALQAVEALELAAFDKPQDNGTHRVFSATCASLESGRTLFRELKDYLSLVPGLVGKMKFERTTRFLRVPADAPALPLTDDSQLSNWLRNCESKTK